MNEWKSVSDIPAKTDESQQMSKALKKRGFSFVGPTICYAFMQACGMVLDHPHGSPQYKKNLEAIKDDDDRCRYSRT